MIKDSVKAAARSRNVVFGSASTLGSNFPLPKSDTSYDPKWAYALSVISGWAYAEGQILADKLQFYGFRDCTVTEIVCTNPSMFIVATAYFIRSADGRVGVLAFRGTEPTSLINWLTDADTSLYPFGKGLVHTGFYLNVESIWADIVEVIEPTLKPSAAQRDHGAPSAAQQDNALEELYVTGHSLGGAMAVIAAARISQEGEAWTSRLRGVYTFGQPMVGNEAFADSVKEGFGRFLYRHIYDDDIVPCLPPYSVDEKFVHFGKRRESKTRDGIWLEEGTDRRAHLTAFASIVESFLTRRIDMLHGIRVDYSLDDHSPTGYIEISRNSITTKDKHAHAARKPPSFLGRIAGAARGLLHR